MSINTNRGIEAFWTVKFGATQIDSPGAGVVVLETNKVYGGDGNYYYKGDYSVENGIVHIKIEVIHFFGSSESVFGPSIRHTIELSGKTGDIEITLEGHLVSLTPPQGSPSQSLPTQTLRAKLTRIDELP